MTTTSSMGAPTRPTWRTVNISVVERLGRIILGAGGMTVGGLLLPQAGSVWKVILEVLLVLAGVDLLVTGATGHCPLYQKLGHVPRSLRNAR